MHGTPGPVSPLLFGPFFFVTVTIYLERLRPIKLITNEINNQKNIVVFNNCKVL